MTDREVMQQALEALEAIAWSNNTTWQSQRAKIEVDALRTALAQPEQEPVAWEHHEYRPYGAPGEIRIHAILASQYMMPDGSVSSSFQWLVDEYKKDKNTIKLIPLYAAPSAAQRPWQGLTDEEVAIASAEFDTKLKLAFHAGMYKAQIILRKKNDPRY
jgi:hypothetical protein